MNAEEGAASSFARKCEQGWAGRDGVGQGGVGDGHTSRGDTDRDAHVLAAANSQGSVDLFVFSMHTRRLSPTARFAAPAGPVWHPTLPRLLLTPPQP